MSPSIHEVLYCYTEWQPEYSNIQRNNYVKFNHGLPEIDNLVPGKRRLVILDDLMSQIGTDIETVFTRKSHHRDISILILVQNTFPKSFRTISLNAHYIVVFKQPRDMSQIMYLARQFSPKNVKYVTDSFYKATQEPYGYLVFDFRQETPDVLRLRTKIFPGENLIVYVPKQ